MPPSVAAENDDARVGQIPLTEIQIEALLAAQKPISAILDDVPEDQERHPDLEIQAALSMTARQYGFRNYGEYDDVASNITFILEGFDRQKKMFVGQEAILRKRIAATRDDRRLRLEEKLAKIDELTQDLRFIEPIEYPQNITLIAKYYDRLSDIFDDDR